MHDQHEPDVASAGTGPTGVPRCPEHDPCGITGGQCVGREGHPGPHFEGSGYRWDAGPPASTDAVSPDERARGTSQAADTTAEAARALGLAPRPIL